ncbi:uncharacterized protein MELLADRAFT_74936 [Melampsora larici-populina 98AG31]|uniref:Ribosome biogenesis protein YTM1 n=1 Tax=Melampsora larici-populina (strain 98AG31 / pathotype 3-4-7) TaxID=747676 RepID=F4RP63_MELLP|nr:uncharacterized protein MELLADRAFT_74936 [Melampsora larici-populina 98AG31]EGG05904.1 hypothetical protein MELLADRAFT_74936 [Melampsora larici-populina 98AG31]
MIPVRLVTKSKQYAIPNAKYMVPSDWKRFQLSELINKVLEHSQPIPFDFVIEDQLLRTSVKTFIDSRGLSTESILEIEYLESVLPPKYVNSFQHDDWISHLDVSRTGTFLTACYDANLRLFSSNDSSKPFLTIPGHDQPILSTTWIPNYHQAGQNQKSDYLASGGMDRVIRVWRLDSNPAHDDQILDLEGSQTATTTHVLALHKSPVSTIKASSHATQAGRLITGDWDGIIGLWDLGSQEHDKVVDFDQEELERAAAGEETRISKKRKKRDGTNTRMIAKQPIQVINVHQAKVARALFSHFDHNKAFSASHDHSVKRLDLETGVEDWCKVAGPEKCLLDIDECKGREGLLVTGGMDRTVCFWDVREESQNVSLTLYGHQAPVSSISSNPSNTHSLQILSGSFDGTCKIWDTRSIKESLYTIQKPNVGGEQKLKKKILSVGWNSDGNLLGFGGEDCELSISSVN